MGLDIHIGADNYKELYSEEYYDKENDYFNKHRLSRTFCNFMCRKAVISHEPELDQIGKITGVDIRPFYEMETYVEEYILESHLEYAKSEEDKQDILKDAQEGNAKLHGNLDKVLITVSALIDELNTIDNLPELLLPTNFNSLDNNENNRYFIDFKVDKGQGYMGNNLGQDLRNFKRFLEYAKAKGTTTVWFSYS